jgi:hypothetical protein
MNSVSHVKQTLVEWRSGETDEWEHERYGPFTIAEKLAKEMNFELSLPRRASRQTMRNNVPGQAASEYYRRAIWYPYLDHILEAICDKFSDHTKAVYSLMALVPASIENFTWEDIISVYNTYSSQLDSEEEVRNEYYQWKNLCKDISRDRQPSSPLETLDVVPEHLRNIRTLLWIFSTIPVTTCTAERAFSSLKLLKTFLRNRMTDDRLTGLAHLYIHNDLQIDPSEVLDRFASMHSNRRVNFML